MAAIRFLRVGHVLVVNHLVSNGRDGVLPEQLLGGHFGAEVALLGAHVAVRELEPGAGEGIGKRGRVFVEAARNHLIRRVGAQGDVGGEHEGGVLHGRVVGIGDGAGPAAVHGAPLVGTGGALGQLPLVAEQVVEVVVAPLGGRARPGAFEAAGDGVLRVALAEAVAPALAQLFEGRAGGLAGHEFGGVGRAVGFAEGVAAGNQGHGFFVVHGHAAEGFADVAGRALGDGLTVGAFGVHVDKAHLHGGQRVFQLPVVHVALVAEPLGFGAPVHVFLRLPHVGPATAEAEGLQAHRLQGAVAGQNHEVGPGDLLAVFLLDGPQQQAGLVEVGVVGPAIEGGEALRARARAATAVGNAVGAGAVPGHPNEEGAVVAVVGRPPVLRVGHQLEQVLLHGVQVELLELFGVVEVLVHRVDQGRVLAQDAQLEQVGPPLAVGAAPAGRLFHRAIDKGALGGIRVQVVEDGVVCGEVVQVGAHLESGFWVALIKAGLIKKFADLPESNLRA